MKKSIGTINAHVFMSMLGRMADLENVSSKSISGLLVEAIVDGFSFTIEDKTVVLTDKQALDVLAIVCNYISSSSLGSGE